jgi:Flp pilus assembly protein TadG
LAKRIKNALPFLRDDHASQIVEFAISLPLLLVVIVGIFDFGAAFNVKQKLNHNMREAARFGAGLPTSDMEGTLGIPASITAIRYLVDANLVNTGVNECGLGAATINAGTNPYTWTVNPNVCPGTTLLTIERQYSLATILSGQATYVMSTHVSINYPYQWHFNNVIQLLVPGTNYGAVLQIQTDALMPNMQ